MQALSYYKFSEYEPVGSEFSQKADTVRDAYFSVPKIKLYDSNSSCEGTIDNGEYCGYYRRYDGTGKLIF